MLAIAFLEFRYQNQAGIRNFSNFFELQFCDNHTKNFLRPGRTGVAVFCQRNFHDITLVKQLFSYFLIKVNHPTQLFVSNLTILSFIFLQETQSFFSHVLFLFPGSFFLPWLPRPLLQLLEDFFVCANFFLSSCALLYSRFLT